MGQWNTTETQREIHAQMVPSSMTKEAAMCNGEKISSFTSDAGKS